MHTLLNRNLQAQHLPTTTTTTTITTTQVSLTFCVPIIAIITAILDIWKTTLFYEGESVVYDGRIQVRMARKGLKAESCYL